MADETRLVSAGELPARARAWVLSLVPGATRVLADSRLPGGLSADTRLLRVERATEPPIEVVLKRVVDVSRGALVAREAEALAALADAPLPYRIARLLGRDDAGRDCDVPALLTSRIPGRIAVQRDGWEPRVRALGEALAAFHALGVPCPPSIPDYVVVPEAQRREAVPDVPCLPDWETVWRFAESGSWDGGGQLLHGDYHLGNALFEDERLTGIIDWASARRGRPELEVGYCRVDLSMLLGGDAPAQFLRGYEARLGARVQDVSRWDLGASLRAFPDPVSWLPGWLDAGRQDLEPSLIRGRLRDFVQNALSLV